MSDLHTTAPTCNINVSQSIWLSRGDVSILHTTFSFHRILMLCLYGCELLINDMTDLSMTFLRQLRLAIIMHMYCSCHVEISFPWIAYTFVPCRCIPRDNCISIPLMIGQYQARSQGGVRGVIWPPPKWPNSTRSQDNPRVIIKGPQIWPIWPPPQKSLATGLNMELFELQGRFSQMFADKALSYNVY